MNTETNITENRIYQWEGIVFNLLCALAYVLLGPTLVETASLAVDGKLEEENRSAAWLGFLIILVSLLEIYAFPIKMRYIREAIREHGDDGASGFVLWMFHAVVSIILVFVVSATFGQPVISGQESEPSAWVMVTFFVVVIKELGLLLCLFVPAGGSPEPAYARPNRREKVVDLILLGYAFVVHCVVWGTISRMDLQPGEPVMFVVNLFAASLVFLMLFLPLRIPYWIEEMARAKTVQDWLILAGSVLAVLIPALWAIA